MMGPSSGRRWPATPAGAGLAVALLLSGGVGHGAAGQEGGSPERRAARTAQEPPAGAAAEALVERFAARAGEALGLDRERRERLLAELQRSWRERRAILEHRRALLRELVGLVRSRDPDPARADSLARELLDTRVRLARIEVEEYDRLSEFLSPLQRIRFLHLKRRLAERALDGRPGERIRRR